MSKSKGKAETTEVSSYSGVEEVENDKKNDNPTNSADHDPAKKRQAMMQRAKVATILFSSFVIIVMAGHIYLYLLSMIISIKMYMEIIAVKNREKVNNKYHFKSVIEFLSLFNVIVYFALEIVEKHMKNIPSWLQFLVNKGHVILYGLALTSFIIFVLSLRKGMMRYQFSHFSWILMILIMITIPSNFSGMLVFQGIIWWLYPVLLVIGNDLFAYFAGITMGHRIFDANLIELSPKKTWEGYLFGGLLTIILGFVVGSILQTWPFLTCPSPMTELDLYPFSSINPTCDVDPFFTEYKLYDFVLISFSMTGFQSHSIIYTVFASVIAPFGGFFASGMKRAFKIKDFGNELPGHGGISDRFDCQVLMLSFSFIYYYYVIDLYNFFKLTYVIGAISRMSNEERQKIIEVLGLKC